MGEGLEGEQHGVWDYDFPTSANLLDITVDGKKIKALAQVSKQGFTYVFDRVTGEPVWPIEEREVPQSTVPGEKTSKTQPFPTKPPAFEKQGLTEDDLIDFTPELSAEALKIASDYELAPLFTPPIVKGTGKPVIVTPGDGGGANWTGAAVDPETGYLYVPSMNQPRAFHLGKPGPNRSNLDYVPTAWSIYIQGPQGLPLFKPPYSRVVAIDLNEGEHAWMQPHGDGPKDHPAIKDLNLGPLGDGDFPQAGAALVTKTLLFVTKGARGSGLGSTIGVGRGKGEFYISVYDKITGDYLGAIPLKLPPYGMPISYLLNGKQYIAVAGGGQGFDGEYRKPEVVVLSLP